MHHLFLNFTPHLIKVCTFECRCVCPQTGQVCLHSLIHRALFCVECLGSWLSVVHLLSPSLVVLVSGGLLPLCFPCGFLFGFRFVVLRGSFLLLLLFGFVVGCRLCLFVVSVCLGCVRFGSFFPCFPLPSPPPFGLSFVPSGPVSALLVPPSGYLVVFATVRLSYLRYGVLWLIGSCLHSSSWQQRLRPCVGLCPLHHVVGVVQVPLAPALRYSPLGDPETP